MVACQYTLGELADKLALDCIGDREVVITGLATLASASQGQLSFLANPKYQKDLLGTKASAVIVSAEVAACCPTNALVAANPYLSYAQTSQLFDSRCVAQGSIHHSAVVSTTAKLAPNVSIAANAVIGEHVTIAANTSIGAGVVIGDYSVVGEDCLLHANVTVYHGVTLGDRVTLHSGCVIGSDGFGFAPSPTGYIKIAQLGGVKVGCDVEIGAGTTIDRGALDDTLIGNGVIIDNQVQVAHNVQVGDNTAIAGKAGIAGSTIIGKQCTLAGGVGLVGHITIADKVHITAHTVVSKSITKAGSYSSGTGMQETSAWRKSAVRITQLDDIAKRLQRLEKR